LRNQSREDFGVPQDMQIADEVVPVRSDGSGSAPATQ
jgi:hypothetical protein